MQAMTQMMEMMNFVMGNVCDRLDMVEKCSNEAGLSTQDVRKLGLNRKQTVAVGSNGQGGLIMRILRRPLMILVMVVLRMRPCAIRKVFSSLETEGILGIELGANSAKGKISVMLRDMLI
jgi:hypothetical protein